MFITGLIIYTKIGKLLIINTKFGGIHNYASFLFYNGTNNFYKKTTNENASCSYAYLTLKRMLSKSTVIYIMFNLLSAIFMFCNTAFEQGNLDLLR